MPASLLCRPVGESSQLELALLNERILQNASLTSTDYLPAMQFESAYLTTGQYYRLKNRSAKLAETSAEGVKRRLLYNVGKLACSRQPLDAPTGRLTPVYVPTANQRATYRQHPSNQRLALALTLESPTIDWEQQHVQRNLQQLGGVGVREVLKHPHVVLGTISEPAAAETIMRLSVELPLPQLVTLEPLA